MIPLQYMASIDGSRCYRRSSEKHQKQYSTQVFKLSDCHSYSYTVFFAKQPILERVPVQMQHYQCWSWPYEAELGGCPSPADCSFGAPPLPHLDAVAQPAISSSFQTVSKRWETNCQHLQSSIFDIFQHPYIRITPTGRQHQPSG